MGRAACSTIPYPPSPILYSLFKGSPACAGSDWSSSFSWIKVGGTLPRLRPVGSHLPIIMFVGDGGCRGYRTLQGTITITELGRKIKSASQKDQGFLAGVGCLKRRPWRRSCLATVGQGLRNHHAGQGRIFRTQDRWAEHHGTESCGAGRQVFGRGQISLGADEPKHFRRGGEV